MQNVLEMFFIVSLPIPFNISSYSCKWWWLEVCYNHWWCLYPSIGKSTYNSKGVVHLFKIPVAFFVNVFLCFRIQFKIITQHPIHIKNSNNLFIFCDEFRSVRVSPFLPMFVLELVWGLSIASFLMGSK